MSTRTVWLPERNRPAPAGAASGGGDSVPSTGALGAVVPPSGGVAVAPRGRTGTGRGKALLERVGRLRRWI